MANAWIRKMQNFDNLILVGPDLDDFDKGFEIAFKRILQLKGIPIHPYLIDVRDTQAQ